MSECRNDSVDLIVTSPPYNIGTQYGSHEDRLSFEGYQEMMDRVVGECFRVLKTTGKMLIEVADSIVVEKRYIQLARMIQDRALDRGFFLVERHINFIKTRNGIELPDHDWNDSFYTERDAHSNCHQWLVFSKKKRDFEGGGIYYVNYEESKDHPCPFSQEECEILLEKYFHSGDVVLDPFMGVAVLGGFILKREGFFRGYEIDRQLFGKAKRNLDRVL